MLQRQLGQLVINRIVESERPDFDPLAFFPHTTPADWAPHKAWLQPRAMDPVSGNLIFPMQSWLVRTRHHTILVDTCIGDHKKRQRPSWNMTTSGVFLAQLADSGVHPEAVDYVLCTHLHVDHVGWVRLFWNSGWETGFGPSHGATAGRLW
jgi:glyoxylase-like metal-dependent hydrolase (beta-lactamase superfamily II)